MASSAARQISIHPTDVKGVADNSEFRKLSPNEGTFTVVSEPVTKESATRKDFGAAGDSTITGEDVSGDLGTFDFFPQFSGTDDFLLLASIYATGWVELDSVAGHQVAIDGATYNGTTGVLDLTAASGGIPDQLVDGQAVELYLDADNYFVVELTEITPQTWAVSPAPVEGSGAGELPATLPVGWKMISERARNALETWEMDIKDYQTDIGVAEYFPFALFQSGTWAFNIEENIQFTPTVTGLYSDYKENNETYPGETLVTPAAHPIMVTGDDSAQLIIDGVNQALGCAVSSLELTIERTINTKKGVFVKGSCGLNASNLDITGSMTVAFKDVAYIQRAKENTPLGMFIAFPHSDNIGYAISVPRFFTQPSKSEQDEEVILDTEFTAAHDDELGFAIQYCRFRRAA
jgi:hypothetical protein